MEQLNRDTIIWEGRFQPVHLGHIAYVRHLLTDGRPVWIYLVGNETSADAPELQSPVPNFTAIVDEHHRPGKNPLPFWLRYQLLVGTLRAEFGDRSDLFVWGGRRMDLHWPFTRAALPPRRSFLLSKKDDFEDAKAAAWAALGERVERIEDLDGPGFRATDFRAALSNGAPIDEFLSPHTLRLLDEMGAREFFCDAIRAAARHD